MIPSYNCSNYLREALLSVLTQDPGPEYMQIEVIDDHSTDTDVQALVAEIGKGRIGFFRQQENVGSLRNFETCLNRSIGHWVHLLHGDDLVQPGFYTEIEKLFHLYPQAGAAFTGYHYIDEKGEILFPNQHLADKPGIIDNWLPIIAQSQQIQPPAIVVKREVYEQLGGFFGMHYGEDWEMWVRISVHYPMAHSPKYLAHYRIHNTNITSRGFKSGQNIKDITTAIEIIQHYLPCEEKKKLKNLARKNFSVYFARSTDKVYYDYKNPRQALAQAWNALKMHRNATTFYYFFKIYTKLLIRYKFNSIIN
jgi:glycosyltransferase involved in cell wall biosynthesis